MTAVSWYMENDELYLATDTLITYLDEDPIESRKIWVHGSGKFITAALGDETVFCEWIYIVSEKIKAKQKFDENIACDELDNIVKDYPDTNRTLIIYFFWEKDKYNGFIFWRDNNNKYVSKKCASSDYLPAYQISNSVNKIPDCQKKFFLTLFQKLMQYQVDRGEPISIGGHMHYSYFKGGELKEEDYSDLTPRCSKDKIQKVCGR